MLFFTLLISGILSHPTEEHVRMSAWESWAIEPSTLPTNHWYYIYGAPYLMLFVFWLIFRVLWRVHSKKGKPLLNTGGDGIGKASHTPHFLAEGEASQSQLIPYLTKWTETFDLPFLIGMAIFCPIMIGLTYVFDEDMLYMPAVWFNFLVKFGVMLTSSIIGGIIARWLAHIDDRGYIATGEDGKTITKCKGFKVNYTRKIQHFAAYAVPVLVPSPIPKGPLELAWSDWATLVGFLVMIKPLRERFSFLMMQFNSMDRPEDRPHTLKWIILGDIVPGMFVIIFFHWILSFYTVNSIYSASGLVFIFLMVTGIGDGFAEPVGVYWGKHKYKVGSLMSKSKRLYTRSWEGSACVAWTTYLFVSWKWFLFPSITSYWLTFIVLPPLMAYAEARSPHTMDTPCLFFVGGLWLYASLFIQDFF